MYVGVSVCEWVSVCVCAPELHLGQRAFNKRVSVKLLHGLKMDDGDAKFGRGEQTNHGLLE